ncbi:MAG: T9SS type A sorting domain-containing protein [bacterium]
MKPKKNFAIIFTTLICCYFGFQFFQHNESLKVSNFESSTIQKFEHLKVKKFENSEVHKICKAHKINPCTKANVKANESLLFKYETKEYEKPQKFDVPYLFAELHTMIRTREGEEMPSYKPNQRHIEYVKAVNNSDKKFREKPQAQLNWIERGPGNVGGRTRAFIVDPTDTSHQTWFAGSVAGGIWKTTDKGQNWRNLTPFLPNLATTTLAYSGANPDIIYAGTGEGFMNLDAVNGDGIFKSTDHGETWTQIPSSARFKSINRIIVDPANPNMVLCCANDMNVSGNQAQRYFQPRNSTIEKSTNGGVTWRTVYEAGEYRVQQIIADPNNFNIQYASINGIGIIKSTNAGSTWFESSDGLGLCQRIEMAISPSNTNKLYLSVENGSTSDFYMTENAGALWYLVNDIKKNNSWLSSQGWYDNCIAVHPFNENIIFVGGVNIFKIEMQSGQDSVFKITDIEKNNIDSYMTFYDSGLPYENGGIGRGEDFWDEELLGDDEYTTVEIRLGQGRSQKAHRFIMQGDEYIYKDYVNVPFEVQDLKNLKQIGVSFVDRNNNSKFDLLESDEPEFIITHAVNYSNQANNNIKSSIKYKPSFIITPLLKEGAIWDALNIPSSKLKIYWDAVYTKKRKTTAVTDGYGQFGNPNNNSIVHVDQHNITMIPIDEQKSEYWILIGNDGGVAYSTNGGTNWTETDHNGYNTSQFYGCDKKPGANEYIGGTQDNGTYISNMGENANWGTKYRMVIGGDGFEAVWNYKDSMKLLGSSQFNTLRKSTDGGETWFGVGWEITDGYGTGGPFVTKLAKSLYDADLVFAVGKSGVWRSENFGSSWQLLAIPDSLWRSGGYYSNAQVEISVANPQIVWAAVNMSEKGRIQLSTDGGLSFNPVNNYELVPMGRLTGLESHPIDENTAYSLFSFANAPKILKTTDKGESWFDISGFDDDSVSKNGFPDVAVYCLQVMPFDTNIIWVGTEIGLFESTDNAVSWHYADNGLPPVAIWQMKIVDDQVVVATHGRGIWSVTLPQLKDYEPPNITLAPNIQGMGQSPTGKLAIKTNLRSVYDSTSVFVKSSNSIDFVKSYTLYGNEIAETKIKVDEPVDSEEVVNTYIISYKNGREYKTGVFSTVLYPLGEEQVTYYNDFEESKQGFGGNGFSVDTIPKFIGSALQTRHKYQNNSAYQNILLTPIVVADSLAMFNYEDIAIVEPGEEGSEWGQGEFYDYVVVEATRDGFDWFALGRGYDAKFDSLWLAVYNGDTALTQDMYRKHEVDLLDYFDKRDTILIRFRLYADQGANGWGWTIDNIDIQPNGYLDVKDSYKQNDIFRINKIYPNPATRNVNIDISLNTGTDLEIVAYDIKGKLLSNVFNYSLQEGEHLISFDTKNIGTGTVFLKFKSKDRTEFRKIVIMK